MKTKVRVAVIGVGALGEHHARIYAELTDAVLVAVVDLQEERARGVAAACHCQSLTDYRLLYGQVEAVSLAVPTERHAEVGVELLEKGVHVLVEKPLAASLEQADQLIAARNRSGSVLQVGHSERFNPALQAVLPRITTPQFFEAHRLGVFVRRSLDIDVVLDLMIHDLDLIAHLVGSPLAEIRAVGIPVLTPLIDIANARLEFENGCVANVTASRVSRDKVRKLRFFQPHDYVSIDFHQQEVEMFSVVESEKSRQIIERHLQVERGEPLKAEIQSFLQETRGGPVAGCSAEDARRALEMALQILEQIG